MVGKIYWSFYSISFILHGGTPLHYKFSRRSKQVKWLNADFSWEARLHMLTYVLKFNSLQKHFLLILLKFNKFSHFRTSPNFSIVAIRSSVETIRSIVCLKLVLLSVELKQCIRNSTCYSTTSGAIFWILLSIDQIEYGLPIESHFLTADF